MPQLKHSLALATLALCAGACIKSPARINGFEVAWSTSSPSISVTSADGRLLLQTQGGLLETQNNTATWQEEFGAFLVMEENLPWNEPTSMSVQFADTNELTFNVKMSNGGLSQMRIFSPGTGVLEIALTADPDEDRLRTGFVCQPTDHFLGFGSQTDAIDHYGHYIPIWSSEPGIGKTDMDLPDPNTDWFLVGTRHQASYPLPTFVSSHGFAFLDDTTRRAIFDVCQTVPDRWSVETWDSQVILNIYDGPTPAAAVERLTADKGRQPLANDLVLAPWNDGIFGSAHVRQVAAELRAAHIPSSAIWTEDFRGGSFSGTNYQLSGEWDVDQTLYPDIEQLASDLHGWGFRFFAYHNTFADQGTNIFAQAQAAGVLIQQKGMGTYLFEDPFFLQTSMVDLSTSAGTGFVSSWLQKFMSYGFDGWMTDYAEWLPTDAVLASGADAEEYHNTYPRVHHAISAAVFAASNTDPDTRAYFARSGCIGDAPYQPVVWGGDQLTSFDQNDGMPSGLMKGLNLGLAGIAIFGTDIAGYQNDSSLGFTPSTKELFFRWTTLGALSTVMRTHHGVQAALDWAFDTDAETTAHFARWAQFHARLWPYLRVAAQQAYDTGAPIMRMMPFAFPDDSSVWTITDEYEFGPSILVAPVMVEGATSRTIYLPAGSWLPFWTGVPIEGPMQLTADLPVTEIGLYAQAGSIIPMLPTGIDTFMPANPPFVTLDAVRNDRVLAVFGGADGSWTDLDGTEYTLHSATSEPVTSVSVGGVTLASCASTATPCADIDPTNRTVTVQGESLTSVELDTLSGASTLTVSGGQDVQEVDFRY